MAFNKRTNISVVVFFTLCANLRLFGQSLYNTGGSFKGKVKTVVNNYKIRRLHIWWRYDREVYNVDTSGKIERIASYHNRDRLYEEKKMKYLNGRLVEICNDINRRNFKITEKDYYFYNDLGQIIRDSSFDFYCDASTSSPHKRVNFFYSYSGDGKICYRRSLVDSSIVSVSRFDSSRSTYYGIYFGRERRILATDTLQFNEKGEKSSYVHYYSDSEKPDEVKLYEYQNYDANGNWLTQRGFFYLKAVGRKREWKKQTRAIVYY